MSARILLAQLHAVHSSTENLEKITEVVRKAGQNGAQMVVFPEYMMSYPAEKGGRAERQPLFGPFAESLRILAREYGMWLVCGMTERPDEPYSLPYNTILVIDSAGGLAAAHRKTHLYDAFQWQESKDYRAGWTPFVPVETPWGRMGLACCYELRFPEIFTRQMCDFFIVPAAWTCGPHKLLHWRTLLAARAIENGVPVLGCTQTSPKVFTGGTAAFAPTGECLGSLDEAEDVLEISLDLTQNDQTTRQNRRPELYTPKNNHPT